MELPPEIQSRVASFCAPNTLAVLAQTNRKWNAVANDVLAQTVRVTFDPVPEHASDHATLRQLWLLSQNAVSASRVRVLGLSVGPLGWLEQKAACSRCGPRTKVARCISYYQPLPSLTHNSDLSTMFDFAMRNPVRCRFLGVRNVVIAYAHLCVALAACTNVVRAELPSLQTTEPMICDRALGILCRLQHLQVVQLSVGYVANQFRSPWTHYTPNLSPEFLQFIRFMTSRSTPDRRRLVIISATSLNFGTREEVNGLAEYGVSAIGTAHGKEHVLRIYPALYRSAGTVSRYMNDVSLAFVDSPCATTVVNCSLDPQHVLGTLPEVALVLSRESATIEQLYLIAEIPSEGQRDHLGDLPPGAGDAGAAVMRALHPLGSSLRFIWLRRLGNTSTCWQAPFSGRDLRPAAEDTWHTEVVIHEWVTG